MLAASDLIPTFHSPPISQSRRFTSTKTTLDKEVMADIPCSCDTTMSDSRGCCPACVDRQQSRHYRLSGRKQLAQAPPTPPPSEPPTPRASSDQSRTLPLRPRSRDSSASAAINSAFSSEDDHADIFPLSIYQRHTSKPRRASPRGSMSTSSPTTAERSTIRRSNDLARPTASLLPRPSTPDSIIDRPREYSPMAAGFARLSRKPSPAVGPGVAAEMMGRGRDERPSSFDMQRRMFDGPC